MIKGKKSFNGTLNGKDDVLPMKPFASPRFDGGNVVIVIDDEDYQQKVKALIFSVVGKLSL